MTLHTDIVETLRHPTIPMEEVVIRAGALEELTRIIGSVEGRLVLLVDETPFRSIEDSNLKHAVATALVRCGEVAEIVVPGQVHADEQTVDRVVAEAAGATTVVTFGSGTLSDIGKVAARSTGARHIIVQSAASVNGFADDQSVLLVKGAKRTVPSAWPDAIVADIDVVSAAPVELNASGLGDMISMFTAPADWYLSSLFGLDRGWDADAAVLTRRHGETLLQIAPGIAKADPEAARCLTEFVTLSGLSMGLAGQTSPSSGMEHTVSHMLDMARGARGEATAYHGAQVGVATVLVSVLWRRMAERLAAGELRSFRVLNDEEARARIDTAFGWMDADGATAEECWKEYRKKLAHLRSIDAVGTLTEIQREWPRHAERLDTMLGDPARIAAALQEASGPSRFSELNVPVAETDVIWAATHCHLMRNRFTIADLAFATGYWGDEEVASTLQEAASHGGRA